MKNLTGFNKFISSKTDKVVNESVQLGTDINGNEVWKASERFEIPTKFINEYIKKVNLECGIKIENTMSPRDIVDEIVKYLPHFLEISNFPSSIVASINSAPTVQSQEEMPVETQVQAPVQEPAAQPTTEAQPAAQAPTAQPTAQPTAASVAQEIPAAAPAQSAI